MPEGSLTEPGSEIAALQAMVGQEIGRSVTLELTQDRVTAFGGVTLDFDPHHIDPAQAKHGPFGEAAAQGFLTLSLLTYFSSTMETKIELKQHINYGFNKIRFMRPALVGHHLYAVFTLADINTKRPGAPVLTFNVEIFSKELDAPVMFAEWLAMLIV